MTGLFFKEIQIKIEKIKATKDVPKVAGQVLEGWENIWPSTSQIIAFT